MGQISDGDRAMGVGVPARTHKVVAATAHRSFNGVNRSLTSSCHIRSFCECWMLKYVEQMARTHPSWAGGARSRVNFRQQPRRAS